MRSIYRSLRSNLALALALLVAIPITGSVAAISLHNAAEIHAIATTSNRSSTGTTGRALFTLSSQWSTTAQNDRLAAINTDAASGFLDVYTGTQPANANATVTGTRLCSWTLGATAFHTPSSGTMTSNGALSCTASASGTAGYVVLYKADHTTVLWMGSAGTGTFNVNLVTTTIASGVQLTLADAAFTLSDVAAPSGL